MNRSPRMHDCRPAWLHFQQNWRGLHFKLDGLERCKSRARTCVSASHRESATGCPAEMERRGHILVFIASHKIKKSLQPHLAFFAAAFHLISFMFPCKRYIADCVGVRVGNGARARRKRRGVMAVLFMQSQHAAIIPAAVTATRHSSRMADFSPLSADSLLLSSGKPASG